MVTTEGKEGFYTVAFKRFLDLLLKRVGGVSGGLYGQLTFGAAITWDLDASPSGVIILAGNPIITAINQVAGNIFPYRLTLVQDSAGSRIPTWDSMFKFPSGAAPTLSVGANAVDELWFSSDGTNMKLCVFSKDIR